MKPGLAKFGLLLLVMVVAMVGLTSCERKAEPRESEATETVVASQTSGVVSGAATPVPGETIVSAVTPAPQQTDAAGQPTAAAPAEGTPAASGPTATTAPEGTTEQPTVAPAATQPGAPRSGRNPCGPAGRDPLLDCHALWHHGGGDLSGQQPEQSADDLCGSKAPDPDVGGVCAAAVIVIIRLPDTAYSQGRRVGVEYRQDLWRIAL